MHHRHVELGAVMVDSDGWQRPARYAEVDDEVRSVERASGIADVSSVGKLLLHGSDVDLALSGLLDRRELPCVGEALDHGTDAGRLVAAKLAQDEIMVITEPAEAANVLEGLGREQGGCSHAVDLTSGLAGIRIAGPASHLVLAGVTEMDVAPDAFTNAKCGQSKFAEVYGTLLRLDSGGLPTYDLFVGREVGEYVWESLMEAGREYDAVPYGLEAMSRLGIATS